MTTNEFGENMTPQALKALKGSILKWKKIAAGTGEDRADLNCPLCELFFHGGCRGCPVAERTGEEYCEGSPYRKEWGMVGYPTMAVTEEQKAAAKAELDFLMSLLPVATEKKSASSVDA